MESWLKVHLNKNSDTQPVQKCQSDHRCNSLICELLIKIGTRTFFISKKNISKLDTK